MLVTRLLLFLAIGLAMALVIGGNLYLAYRLRPLLRPHSAEQATLERYRMVIAPRIGTWISALAVIIGFFAGLSAQSRWKHWLLFQNAQPFGVKDPQFKHRHRLLRLRVPVLALPARRRLHRRGARR